MTDLEITRKRSTKFERSAPRDAQIANALLKYSVVPTGCWLWSGTIANTGYGQVWVMGRRFSAHRFFYQSHVGPINSSQVVDHLCRNRSCVNPAHMELVTNKENILRGISPSAENARKTECKRGHKLEGDSVYLYMGKVRMCRLCRVEATKRWREK